jgi:hypothetical protein
MNTLSKDDALLFHKLMNSLLFYVNKKVGSIKNAGTLKEFLRNDVQETMPLREKLFSGRSNLIESYVSENPDKLNEEETKIVASWGRYKTGRFFIIKHAKEHSLFFNSDDQRVYGVKGITDSFEEKFQGYAPVLVDITLLPFREHIIYDGLFAPYSISFGGGMMKSIKQESGEAIQKYGIITSLGSNPVAKQQNDEELLRFYMKSFDNKCRYGEEIRRLKGKSKELEAIYCQEEARDYARHPKKVLKGLGVKGHFAVLLHSVVASGLSEEELKENMTRIVPEGKRSWVYTFRL